MLIKTLSNEQKFIIKKKDHLSVENVSLLNSDQGRVQLKMLEQTLKEVSDIFAHTKSILLTHIYRAEEHIKAKTYPYENNVHKLIKLPPINMPTLDGKFEKWYSNRDKFMPIVHNNKIIDYVHRMYYLKTSLQAVEVIATLSSTAFNFKDAWNCRPRASRAIIAVLRVKGVKPLQAVSMDITDYSASTPRHFLIGRSLLALSELELANVLINPLTRRNLIQQLQPGFWKWWTSEYLCSLQNMWHGHNEDTIVKNLLADNKSSSFIQSTLHRIVIEDVIITQKLLGSAVIKFVVQDTQSVNIVDKPVFLNLIRLGLQKTLTVMCSKILKTQLNSEANAMVYNITKTLSNIEYILETADCWTQACTVIKGRNTFDVTAKETTTDYSSNFVKAFRVIGIDKNDEENLFDED
ncbi:Hypothetical protein CINCED_3A001040 [Cinara cedri]|uniref:Uncharacterized protein n=1 Tax=Cinara cedri TaxID=506608 RepID=A0A5E4MEK7_9HEMI|nr:Hypothetical protein CINCED_3A001040 [Cinara cedri]